MADIEVTRRQLLKGFGVLGVSAFSSTIAKPTTALAQDDASEVEEYQTGLMLASMSYDELAAYVATNEDGYWGQGTSALLAKQLGAFFSMYIYHQYYATIQANSALTSGWHCDGTLAGDGLIVALQRVLGTTQDGVFGTNDIRALQTRMGTYVDGVLSGPSPCVKAMQRRLNAGWF